MIDLLAGALVASYSIIAVFFLKFWVESRDRLFALFSLAFAVLMLQRLALSFTRETMEDQTIFYLMRLAAFLIIGFAIIDKNRR
jgi:hypothetical protein